MTDDSRPNVRTYSPEEVRRLTQLVDEGVRVMQEMGDLKEGLSDTVKAIGEELDIKASQLNKVIRICYKRALTEERHKFEEVEDIIETIGKVS